MRILLPLMVSLVLSACGGSTPQQTLEAYAEALDKGEAKAAYQLLHPEFRERVSEEKFVQRFENQRAAHANISKSLNGARGEPAFIDTTLPYTEFDSLEMSLTSDGWKLTAGLFNFYGQRTARETLHSFIKAVERRKFEVLMRFIPSAYAQYMTPEKIAEQFEGTPDKIDEMVALLRQNKDNLIKSQGNRAWMAYGPYRIDFLKEDGIWKVEDPD